MGRHGWSISKLCWNNMPDQESLIGIANRLKGAIAIEWHCCPRNKDERALRLHKALYWQAVISCLHWYNTWHRLCALWLLYNAKL